MSKSMRRVLAWLPLLGVVALALRAAAVWSQLPQVMASHFAANGVANGWMPRDGFFTVSFATVVPAVLLLGFITDRVGARKPLAGAGLLVLNWLTSALLITVFWGAIDANLDHAPLRVAPVWVLAVVLIPAALAVGVDWRWWLSERRMEAMQTNGTVQLLAEERHGSTTAGLLMLLIGAITFALFAAKAPGHAPWPAWVIIGIVMLAIVLSAAWAWYGFVYRFTTAGVEVRTLGFRLRRIPVSQIRDFKAEEVHPLTDFGGWGIKGFGSDTAYIWGGNRALHIKTFQGDVYLGHSDPERLVRDMEQMSGAVTR